MEMEIPQARRLVPSFQQTVVGQTMTDRGHHRNHPTDSLLRVDLKRMVSFTRTFEDSNSTMFFV